MARSVVLAGTERCGRCLLPTRWCLCEGPPAVAMPVQVDVLMHQREQWRPTSTGKLIERVVAGARIHVCERNRVPVRETVVLPGREVWILHPRGEGLTRERAQAVDVARLQVLLLDGSWGEAGGMMKLSEGWGRPVSLHLEGESRYWLREQASAGQYSTMEALLGLLSTLGMTEAEAALRVHFELHVYASLRARGRKGPAAEYLARSPVRAALPELLEKLHERRPNTEALEKFGD